MQDDRTRWDDMLASLEGCLRAGNREAARDAILAFDAELARYVRGEERVLFPVLERFTSISARATDAMRSEHRSLRKLVDAVAELITREDDQRGLDVIATLRSVMLLHVTKEAWVFQPLMRPVPS